MMKLAIVSAVKRSRGNWTGLNRIRKDIMKLNGIGSYSKIE